MINLQIVGTKVTEILVGYTFTLRSGLPPDDYELQIEGAMELVDRGKSTVVDSEEYALVRPELEALVGSTVISACADDDNGLTMGFDNGVSILVPVDQEYEAWGVAGPGGYRVVSSPGGGYAVWSQQK